MTGRLMDLVSADLAVEAEPRLVASPGQDAVTVGLRARG